MKYRHILLIVGVGILVPIIINAVLLCRNPFPIIEVVGSRTNWLAFYGSYIGGLLPALVSLAILYYTLINSFNQAKIDRQERQIQFLQHDLGKRCSHINFMAVINEVVTQSKNINQKLYDLDNHRLFTLYENINANILSAKLIYNGSSHTQKEFIDCYTEALTKIGEEIQNLQNNYMILAMTNYSQEAIDAFLVYALSSLKNLRTMQKHYYPLITRMTSEIIDEEKRCLLEIDTIKFFYRV